MSTTTLQTETATTTQKTSQGPTYPDPLWSNTTLNYYNPSATPPPDSSNSDLSEHELRIQRRSDDSPSILKIPVSIKNIQNDFSTYSIPQHGFTISTLHSQMQNWRDTAELKRIYFPEISALLKTATGAKEVLSYEWHVRTGTLETALAAKDTRGAVDINGPVRRVHIDETPKSAMREFEFYTNLWNRPDLQNRKFGIFNVWKPLKTVRRDPLCLCEANTIQDEDLHVGKVTVPNVGEIENFAVSSPTNDGAHSWVYLREQREEQCLVFRIFDGRLDGLEGQKRSCGVAHTSFVDPGTEGEEARESVEVRSFCVF